MGLRVAVAGTGYFSRFHFDAWRRLDDVDLVAAASLDPATLAEVGEDYGIEARFADVEAMLDAVRPDLLDIAAPPSAHLELVELAARRGVAVVCQKPLGGDLDTARALVAHAREADIPLVVHENFRFQPWYREARRLIDGEAFGVIHNLSFRLRPGDGQGPRAYLDRQPYFQKMPRFLIHETAIHLIDVFRYLCGEVNGVFARLRRLNPAIRGEDAGYVLFDFEDGAAALFDGNRLIDFPAENPRLTMGELLLEGSAATLRIDGFGRLWLRPFKGEERAHPYEWRNQGFAGDSVLALQQHVVTHLRDGAPIENSGAAYLTNLEIEAAIYQSAATGQRVVLG